MRIKLIFELKEKFLPIDYRALIMSFFKNILNKYSKEALEDFYPDNPTLKEFSFATFLKSPKFVHDKNIVMLNSNVFSVVFSAYDDFVFNSFLKASKNSIGRSWPVINNNKIKLIGVENVVESNRFKENNVIRFASPIVLREHNRVDNSDKYLTVLDDNFVKIIEKQVKKLATTYGVSMEGFSFTPIIMDKTIVTALSRNYMASKGDALLKGNPELIKLLYSLGIGSRRGEGFGLFKIL